MGVTVLPRQPSLSELLGSSFGGGVAQGAQTYLENTLKNKQTQLETTQKQARAQALAKAGGLTPEESKNLTDPTDVSNLLRSRAELAKAHARGIESAEKATSKFGDEMRTIQDSLPNREQSYEEMVNAIPNITTKDKFAEALVRSENPYLRTLGEAASSKDANQLRSGVKKSIAAGGKAAFGSQVRVYEVQLLENATASVGKSKEANLALAKSSQLPILADRKKVEVYNRIMEERAVQGLGRPRDIEQRVAKEVDEYMKPIREQYFRELSKLPGSEGIDIPGSTMMRDPAGNLRRIYQKDYAAAKKAGYKLEEREQK